MKHRLTVLLVFLICPYALAQTPPRASIQGYCEQGGQSVTTSGLSSSTKVQRSYPLCSATVYITGSSGVASGRYTSGGTITGNVGQTCNLAFTGGGGLGATASVALTSTDTIAAGTVVTILTHGNGFTSAPIAATLTSGTATCSGTAVVTSTIGAVKATLYSDDSGTGVSNPITSDSTGHWQFWADNGRYDVTLSGGGITTPFTRYAISNLDERRLYIDVTSTKYGAKCNGTADDTAAIQSAINDAATLNKSVYIPPGNCTVTSLSSTANFFTISGAGMQVSKITARGAGTILTLSGNKPQLSDLTLDGNDLATRGIYLAEPQAQGTFTRVEVISVTAAPGIGVSNQNEDYSNFFDRCIFHYNTIGVKLIGLYQNTIFHECQIFSNSSINMKLGDGTLLFPTRDVVIDGGDISNYAETGVINLYVSQVSPLSLNHVYSESNCATCIDIVVDAGVGHETNMIMNGVYLNGNNVAPRAITLTADPVEVSMEGCIIRGYTAASIFTSAPTATQRTFIHNSEFNDIPQVFNLWAPDTGSPALRLYGSAGLQNVLLGSITTNHGAIQVYDNAATEKVRIHSAGTSYFNGGSVGIGDAPGATVSDKLHVNGSGYVGALGVGYCGTYKLCVNGAAGFIAPSVGGPAVRTYQTDGVTVNGQLGSIGSDNGGLQLYKSDGTENVRLFGSGTSNGWIIGANFGFGTNSPNAKVDINANTFILRTAKTPASATDTCTTGMISWDASYVYVCINTDTWKRAAISTWP